MSNKLLVEVPGTNKNEAEGRTIIIHYNNKKFIFYVNKQLSQIDDEVFDDLLDGTKSYFKIKGRLGKLYENIDGKYIYIDDCDDLHESLEDKEESEALHLYLEDKKSKKIEKTQSLASKPSNKSSTNSKNSNVKNCKSETSKQSHHRVFGRIVFDSAYYCVSISILAGLFYSNDIENFIEWKKAIILLIMNFIYIALTVNTNQLYGLIKRIFLKTQKVQENEDFSISLFKMMTADAKISDIAGIHMVATMAGDVHAAFNEVDTDQSGYIDKKELTALFQKLGRVIDTEEIDKCYEALDENGDDLIDFDEFSKWYLKSENRIESDIQQIFNKFDINNNGFIDIDELENLVIECQGADPNTTKPTSEQIENARKILDENDDGKISKTEFMNWYKSSTFFEQQKKRKAIMGLTMLAAGKSVNDLFDSIMRAKQNLPQLPRHALIALISEILLILILFCNLTLTESIIIICLIYPVWTLCKWIKMNSNYVLTPLSTICIFYFSVIASLVYSLLPDEYKYMIQPLCKPLSLRHRCDPGLHKIECKVTRASLDEAEIISSRSNRCCIVIGQTGVGKTAFLNSMVNYIYNVQFEDKFRLKLIEEQKKDGGQSVSQTDNVNIYQIKQPLGGNIHYDLTIIDTPGFGDTRGLERDQQTIKNIQLLFKNKLNSIDTIFFVVKSSDSRLTATQKYVFNSILNIWCKDMKQNIFLVFTFADSLDPPALYAIKEQGIISDCKYFKLNNSAFMKDPTIIPNNLMESMFNKMFWEIGTLCFDQIFNGVNKLSSKCVATSIQVLMQRDMIYNKIESLFHDLNLIFTQKQEITEENKLNIQYQQEMKHYEENTYLSTEFYFSKESTNYQSVICSVCPNKTCLEDCNVSDISNSLIMGDGGYCMNCNCHYNKHIHAKYKLVKKSKQIQQSDWNDNPSLKQKYENAKSNLSASQLIITQKENKLKGLEIKTEPIIKSIKASIEKLKEIALRPKIKTFGDDFIDILIDVESNNENGANIMKINRLKQHKRKEQIVEQIENRNDENNDDVSIY